MKKGIQMARLLAASLAFALVLMGTVTGRNVLNVVAAESDVEQNESSTEDNVALVMKATSNGDGTFTTEPVGFVKIVSGLVDIGKSVSMIPSEIEEMVLPEDREALREMVNDDTYRPVTLEKVTMDNYSGWVLCCSSVTYCEFFVYIDKDLDYPIDIERDEQTECYVRVAEGTINSFAKNFNENPKDELGVYINFVEEKYLTNQIVRLVNPKDNTVIEGANNIYSALDNVAILKNLGYSDEEVESLTIDWYRVRSEQNWHVDGRVIAKPAVEIDPQEPVDPGPQEPVNPGPQEPVNPGPQEPVNPGPQEPVNPGPQEPVNPVPQEPVNPGPQEPANPVPQEPVNPVQQEPVNPAPQAVVVTPQVVDGGITIQPEEVAQAAGENDLDDNAEVTDGDESVAEIQQIEDDETPLAAAQDEGNGCIIHWIVFVLTLIYLLYAIARFVLGKEGKEEDK